MPKRGFWFWKNDGHTWDEVIYTTGTRKGIMFCRTEWGWMPLTWTCVEPAEVMLKEGYRYFEKKEDLLAVIQDPVFKKKVEMDETKKDLTEYDEDGNIPKSESAG
jgi:hypothetical protein